MTTYKLSKLDTYYLCRNVLGKDFLPVQNRLFIFIHTNKHYSHQNTLFHCGKFRHHYKETILIIKSISLFVII